MRVKRGQGSLEYLVLATVALTVSAVVILVAMNAFGGQAPQISLNNCRAAAQVCKNQLFLNSSASCSQCDTACISEGEEVVPYAATCCKAGLPENIYSGFTGQCSYGADLWADPNGITFSNSNPQTPFPMQVSAKIKNNGLKTSLQTTARLSVKPLGGAYTDVQTVTLPALASSAETTVSFTWPVTDYSNPWTVRVMADPSNTVIEVNENDNTASKTLTNTDNILILTSNTSYHAWNIAGPSGSDFASPAYYGREPALYLAVCDPKDYEVRFQVHITTLLEPKGATMNLYVANSITPCPNSGFALVEQTTNASTSDYWVTDKLQYTTTGSGIYFTYYAEIVDGSGVVNQTTNKMCFKICSITNTGYGAGGGGGTGGSNSPCNLLNCPGTCVGNYCIV